MPTVTTGVNALLTTAGTTTAHGTLTKALQGAVADATRIGTEYMPTTLEVDYILTADQTGETIPANAFSQKGGIAFFGNAPLVAGVTESVGGSLTTGASPNRVELASFSIPATSMVLGAEFRLSAELYINFMTSAPPNEAVVIQFDFGGQTGFDGGQSLFIPLTASRLQHLKLEGIVNLITSGGGLGLSTDVVQGMILNSSYGGANNATMTGKILEQATNIFAEPSLAVTASVANTVKLWVYNLSEVTGKDINVRGVAFFGSV